MSRVIGNKYLAAFAGIVLAATATRSGQAAFVNWQEPAGGWQAVYVASEDNTTTAGVGRLPSQPYSGSETNRPTWTNSSYDVTPPLVAPSAQVVSSGSEGLVLFLDHTTTAGPSFGISSAAEPAVGNATGDNLVTIDMRLRFPANNTLTRQFGIILNRLAQVDAGTTNGNQQFTLWFDTTNNTNAIGLAAGWNDVRITIDQAAIEDVAELGTFVKVYLNDSSTPVTPPTNSVQYSETAAAGVGRRTLFGDFGSSLDGQVELASFKITNNAIASVVVPEPAGCMLIIGGAVGLVLRSRGRFRRSFDSHDRKVFTSNAAI